MNEKRDESGMENTFAVQKQAQLEQAVPDLAHRKQRLQGCIDLLVENYKALCRAVSEDYGHRSEHLTLGGIQGTPARFASRRITFLSRSLRWIRLLINAGRCLSSSTLTP